MIHGVINVYKEKGFTSHDVVAKLRGITRQKKIGHTGTLDPDAVGVLPVCFGKATRLCDMLTDQEKTYETVLLLGQTTDTQDISGAVLAEHQTEDLTDDQVRQVIQGFIGSYEQIPPMYSARKVNGRKLYELAREGIVIERNARTVQILSIEIMSMALPRIRMIVRCSKGTYIRTLCHDIGQKLGCGGCMAELIRTRVGRFRIEDSLKLDQIATQQELSGVETVMLPIDQMFADYGQAVILQQWEKLAFNGNEFALAFTKDPQQRMDREPIRVYDEAGCFIGIYQYSQADKKFSVVKMFYDGNDR